MANENANVSPILLEGALVLADEMNQAQIKHALIGGLAAGYRTHPRFTRDIDFLLHVPQLALPPFLETLHRRGFEFDMLVTIREWTQHHLATLSYGGIRVDWLWPVLPVYQHVLDGATEENWLGHPIRIATVEGLILLKLLAFRAQDLADIENLVAARRNTLDVAWIRDEWQALASLDDPRMSRFLAFVAGEKTSMVL